MTAPTITDAIQQDIRFADEAIEEVAAVHHFEPETNVWTHDEIVAAARLAARRRREFDEAIISEQRRAISRLHAALRGAGMRDSIIEQIIEGR